jgi:hypothetical protein
MSDSTLELVRDAVSSVAPTTGELLLEGEHFCYTLELPWLDNLPDKSCIPRGSYRVILSLSTRFKREMPRLIGVPGRLGILIHPGNTDHDTEGCILLGDLRDGPVLLKSRDAFDRFMTWFQSVGNLTELTIRNAAA